MPQVIGFVIVVVLVIWLIGAVLTAILYALPWMLVSVTGSWLAIRTWRSELAREALIASPPAYELRVTGSPPMISCSPGATESARPVERRISLLAVVGYGIAGLAVLLFDPFPAQKASLEFPRGFVIFLMWVIFIAGAIIVGVYTSHKAPRVIESAVNDHLARLTGSASRLSEWFSACSEIAQLAAKVDVTLDEYGCEGTRARLRAWLVAPPTQAALTIDEALAKTSADKEGLIRAVRVIEEMQQKLEEAVRTVNRVGSPALFQMLDLLHADVADAKSLLSARKFDAFAERMAQAIDSAKQLIDNAEQFADTSGSSTPQEDALEEDPYEILGATKDMSNDEVKRQYRLLAQKLHPDKSKAEWLMKKVNVAYKRICAERGM